MLEDGRSLIQTTGTRRFRMLKKSEKDGYLVANVEWIDDTEEESSGNEFKLMKFNLLIDEIYCRRNSEETG